MRTFAKLSVYYLMEKLRRVKVLGYQETSSPSLPSSPKIPILRHNMGEEEWKAVGRIIVDGFFFNKIGKTIF